MSRHLHPCCRVAAVYRPVWLSATMLLFAVTATLCAAVLALPEAARAEAATGEFVWSQPWLFGTTESSFVLDLVKGPAGSVYAAGATGYGQSSSTAFVARLRTTDGTQMWRQTRAGLYLAAAAGDSSRNVVLAGSKDGDIYVVKYRPDRSLAWTQRWGSPSTTETASDVAVAPDGSIFVSGQRRTRATGRDAVVVCLSRGGDVRWRHVTATKGDDLADAVTSDGAGNAYVTGSRQGDATSSRWATYKLSPVGKRLWLRTVTFISSNTFGSGRWLRVRDNALYVVAQRGTTTDRFAAMKLSLNGKERWLKGSYTLPGPALFNDAAVDAQGRMYIVGRLEAPGVAVQGEILVTRADGTVAWHDEFEDPLGSFSTSYAGVTVDAEQRAYCSGYISTQADDADLAAVVVRYQADAGIETIWRWDDGVSGRDGFGPQLRDSALLVGGRVTTAAGERAIVQRLRP